jgi:phosphoserine phosphatase
MTPLFQVVFFDVDSTLCTIEGIDVLAGGNEEVVRLTEQAMRGEIPIDEVYGRRLEIVRPSRRDVESLARNYVESLTPGAEELVGTLIDHGVSVRLVTAGIEQAVLPLASHLGIPERAVHAVPLRFDSCGEYESFDATAPTARGGGKETVVRNVRARNKGRFAFVGDGMTDLEVLGAVERFIGFGGVAVREEVRDRSPYYVEDKDLRAMMPYLFEVNDG